MKLRTFVLALTGFLLIGAPAHAQPLVTVSCSSIQIDFRTSIQPDSATVEIQSDFGTETHSVTLVQGGTDTRTFPLDGQSGEAVTVTITLFYKGQPVVTSATNTLADCSSPSPSPTVSPQVEVAPNSEASPSPTLPSSPPTTPSPDAISESSDSTEAIIEPLVIRRSEALPAELPRTGVDPLLGLALGLDLILAGLLFRRRANRA